MDHHVAVIAVVVVVIDRPSMPVAAAKDGRKGAKQHQSD
jgi:hypothetical protein